MTCMTGNANVQLASSVQGPRNLAGEVRCFGNWISINVRQYHHNGEWRDMPAERHVTYAADNVEEVVWAPEVEGDA
jgi:hypothetical protein